jgi:hypothetical protein
MEMDVAPSRISAVTPVRKRDLVSMTRKVAPLSHNQAT